MTAALSAALVVGACGEPDAVADGSAVSSTPTSTTAPSTSTTTEPEAEPAAEPASCPLDAATASELLEDDMSPMDVGGQPAECAFESEQWSVTVLPIPDWTTPLPPGQGQRPPGTPDPEVDAPNSTNVRITRSGDWEAMAAITVGEDHWMVTLHNRARGADTYSPAEGPPQRPVTVERLRAVLQHLATLCSSDSACAVRHM